MKPTIKKLDDMTVVGLIIKTTMKDNKIPQLWDEFSKYMDKIPHAVEKNVALGICFWVDMDGFTEKDEFQYMAAIPVTSTDQVPAGLTVRKIPAATYAVFTHQGSLDKLQDTYGKIFTQGLKGYEMANVDEIEWYGQKFKYASLIVRWRYTYL